jgi:hypothetical protein
MILIEPYSDRWPGQFRELAARIRELPDAGLEEVGAREGHCPNAARAYEELAAPSDD